MASTVLKAILRIMGTSALTAWIFVAAPYAWMNRINEMLGMGTLPDTPVVGYLARSNSALYAMLGGLFWVLSLDLPRYRPVLSYLGVGMGLLGAALLAVDYGEGMPLLWILWEGPFLMAVGATVHLLSRRLPDDPS